MKAKLPPELAAVDAALHRAARAAHALARKTKTPCYILKDGVIVDINESRLKARRATVKKTAHREK